MPGGTLRLDPLEPGKVPQNSVESMNRSWVKELIGVQIMGVKKHKNIDTLIPVYVACMTVIKAIGMT